MIHYIKYVMHLRSVHCTENVFCGPTCRQKLAMKQYLGLSLSTAYWNKGCVDTFFIYHIPQAVMCLLKYLACMISSKRFTVLLYKSIGTYCKWNKFSYSEIYYHSHKPCFISLLSAYIKTTVRNLSAPQNVSQNLKQKHLNSSPRPSACGRQVRLIHWPILTLLEPFFSISQQLEHTQQQRHLMKPH